MHSQVTPALDNNDLIICISIPVLLLITCTCSTQLVKGRRSSCALNIIAKPSLTFLIPPLSVDIILLRNASAATTCFSSKMFRTPKPVLRFSCFIGVCLLLPSLTETSLVTSCSLSIISKVCCFNNAKIRHFFQSAITKS